MSASNPMLRYKERSATTTIIIHDSHTPPEVGQVEEVSNWFPEAEDTALHMGLLSLGYHFVIERDGTVKAGREVSKIGSHTPGFNMDSIGICLVGGRERGSHLGANNFTPVQMEALFVLLSDLYVEFGSIPIRGHSEVQRYRSKSLPNCPPIDMDDLRQDYEVFRILKEAA